MPPIPVVLILIVSVVILLLLVFTAANTLWVGLCALCLFMALAVLVAHGETERRRSLREFEKLQTTYDALDEQAKLIIKTDLDLNRAQEELDKKITGLMTLHAWSQRTRVVTDTQALIAQFDEALVRQLGYDKGFLLTYDRSTGQARWSSVVGYAREAGAALLHFLERSPDWRQWLKEQRVFLLNQPDAKPGFETEVLKRCQLASLIAVALPLKDAMLEGLVAMGHAGLYAHVTSGDQDLLSTLANQCATDMENARLDEEIWEAQRALELKVQERTRELALANEALTRLNRAKSDFVNAVAHELRTPLTSIKGYAAILKSGQLGPVPSAQADRLAKIDKHSDDLTQLVNNLLDIARLESGKVSLEFTRVSVEALCQELEDLVRPLVDSQAITLAVDSDGVTALWADRAHLKRAFMNLLSNAIKYTPATGTIRLRFAHEGDRVHAQVSDTGTGIGPEDLPHLFEEFYRANTPMNAHIRGTGLGLTLVQRIIEAHGGKIWVESVVGRGSTFHLLLPAPGHA